MTKKLSFIQAVDELGVLRETIQRLTKREKELKDTLITSRLPEIEGFQFCAMVSCSIREYLNTSKVKELLTQEQIRTCTDASEVIVVRTKRV